MRERLLRAAGAAARLAAAGAAALGAGWAALALWFDGPSSRVLAGILAGGFLLGSAALAALWRPRRRPLAAVALAVAVVGAWWLSLAPRNDRDWQPDVARLPRTRTEGSRVTVENVRDFEWRSDSDFTERWATRTYDLDRLRGVDMFLCYWGPTAICHTIASFEFEGGVHLAVSIETRKEKGESYGAVRGLFRRYELYYAVAEERDVIGVRARCRGETIRLYRMRLDPAKARAILEEYFRSIDRLAADPDWYNALTRNCTTSIRMNAVQAAGAGPFDLRILLNGDLDRLGYERGRVDGSLPFEELRRRSEVTERAKAGGAPEAYSARLREGLPGAGSISK